MNKVSEASQTLAELESPERRLFVKGVAGLGAAFASSSLLSATVEAQADSRRKAPTGNGVSPAQGDWGPFTPSRNTGRYLQLEYPPSTTAGELQLGVTLHSLDPGWYPDRAGRDRASARSEYSGGSGRSNFRLRFALAGSGKEVGLRSSWAFLSRAQRCNRPDSRRRRTVVRPKTRL